MRQKKAPLEEKRGPHCLYLNSKFSTYLGKVAEQLSGSIKFKVTYG